MANPGVPLTAEMEVALHENMAAAQNNLNLSNKGLNHAGNPVSPEVAARAARAAQNRINEIQQVLKSGVQAPKN
jgi:hypothetical protein